MLVALLLTLSITLNVLALWTSYRLWLWVRLSVMVGEPWALMGDTVWMAKMVRVLKVGRSE